MKKIIATRECKNNRYDSLKPWKDELYMTEETKVKFDGLYYVFDKAILHTKKCFENKKISNKMIDVEVNGYCINEKDGWKIDTMFYYAGSQI